MQFSNNKQHMYSAEITYYNKFHQDKNNDSPKKLNILQPSNYKTNKQHLNSRSLTVLLFRELSHIYNNKSNNDIEKE